MKVQYRSPWTRFTPRGTAVGRRGGGQRGWGPGPGKGDHPGRTELVFRPGLSDGWFLAITGSHFAPLLCVSTGKVGSEMLQGTGAGGLGDEASSSAEGRRFGNLI